MQLPIERKRFGNSSFWARMGGQASLLLEAALAKDIDVTADVRSSDKAPDLKKDCTWMSVNPVTLCFSHQCFAVTSTLGGRLPSKDATSAY